MNESEFKFQDNRRTVEILENNYALFMRRAMGTSDWAYKESCINSAKEADNHYFQLTGTRLSTEDT